MQFPNTFQPTDQFAYQTQGILDRPITSETPGRVYFEATYWRARLLQPTHTTLQPGDTVEVLGRNGLTLLIQPKSAEQRREDHETLLPPPLAPALGYQSREIFPASAGRLHPHLCSRLHLPPGITDPSSGHPTRTGLQSNRGASDLPGDDRRHYRICKHLNQPDWLTPAPKSVPQVPKRVLSRPVSEMC
jgi:hypothetical protein